MTHTATQTTAQITAGRSSTPDPRRWPALIVICLAQLMVVLDGTVVNIALPHAQADLGFSTANRQWVITVYALAFGGLLLLGGRIADQWGRRRTLLVGLVGFAGASAIGGAAVNTTMLIGARGLQGAFGALLAPAALSLLTTTFTAPTERAKAFGVYGAVTGAGAGMGLILGGVLTEFLSWRYTLYINIIFAGVAVAGAILTVREPQRGRRHAGLDLPGAALASAGLAAVVFGFSRASSNGWSDSLTLGALAAAVALLAVFVLTQARVPAPLLPLRVITDRNRGGAFLTITLAVIGLFGMSLYLTYYLQAVLGYSALVTGFAFLPLVGGLVIGSTQVGARLATRLPPRTVLAPGLLIAAGGLVILTQISVGSSYVAILLPGQILVGFGLGCAFMPMINLATHGLPENDAGVSSAMVDASQQVGGAIGTALLNTIATTATAGYVAAHAHAATTPAAGQLLRLTATVHGFSTGIWWAAVILAAAAVLGAVLIDAPALGNEPQPTGDAPTTDAPPGPHRMINTHPDVVRTSISSSSAGRHRSPRLQGQVR